MFEHLDKLQALEDRYIDLEAKISDPSVISDQAQWQKYTKAHAKPTDVVETYRASQNYRRPMMTIRPFWKWERAMRNWRPWPKWK